MEVLESISARINPNLWLQLPSEAREQLVKLAENTADNRDLHFVYRGNECIVSGAWRKIKELNSALEFSLACINNGHCVPALMPLSCLQTDVSTQTDTPLFENGNSQSADQVQGYQKNFMEKPNSQDNSEIIRELSSAETGEFDSVIPSPCLNHFESPTNSDDDLMLEETGSLINADVCDNLEATEGNIEKVTIRETLLSQLVESQLSSSEASPIPNSISSINPLRSYGVVDNEDDCQKLQKVQKKLTNNVIRKINSNRNSVQAGQSAGRMLRKRKVKCKKDTKTNEVHESHSKEHHSHLVVRKTNSLYTKKKRLKAKLEGKRLRLLHKLNEDNTNATEGVNFNPKLQEEEPAVQQNATQVPKKRGRKPKLKNPNDLFTCKYCPYTTKIAARLLNHMNRKHEERKYPCQFCDKSFGTKSDQKRHILGHSESYICDICGKVYKSKAFVEQHRKQHHDTFVKPEYPCEICCKVFTAKCSLKQHIDFIHNGNRKMFLCRYCGKSFTQKRHMTEHENKHTGRKPYVCKICGSTFHHSSSLRSHEIIHSEKRDFACDVCGKAFRTKQALVVHNLTHSGTGRFKCDICEKTFTQKQAMLRHTRIHTGERPYTCYLCSDKFNDRSILRRHLIGVHKLSLDKLPKGRRRQFDADLEGLKEGNPGPGLSGALEAAAMSLQGCDMPDNAVPKIPEQSNLDNGISSTDVLQPEQPVESANQIEALPPELSSIGNQQLVGDPIYSHAMSFDVAVAQMHNLSSHVSAQAMGMPPSQNVLDSYNHVMSHHLAGHSLADPVGHHSMTDHSHHVTEHHHVVDHHHVPEHHHVADHHVTEHHHVTDHHVTEHHHVSDHHHLSDHHHVADHHLADHQMTEHQMSDNQVSEHHMVDHQLADSQMTDHHMGDHQLGDHQHQLSDHQLAEHQHQMSDPQMEHQLTAEQLAEHQLADHTMGDQQVSDPHLTAQALSAQQLDHTVHPVSTSSLVPDPAYSQAIPGSLSASAQDLAGLPEPPPAHRHLTTAHYFNGLVSDPQGLPLHQAILPHMSYLNQPQDPTNPVSSYGVLLDAHAQHLHNLHGYGTL